jgi:hypothetical protein
MTPTFPTIGVSGHAGTVHRAAGQEELTSHLLPNRSQDTNDDICSTNAIESLNARYRRALTARHRKGGPLPQLLASANDGAHGSHGHAGRGGDRVHGFTQRDGSRQRRLPCLSGGADGPVTGCGSLLDLV